MPKKNSGAGQATKFDPKKVQEIVQKKFGSINQLSLGSNEKNATAVTLFKELGISGTKRQHSNLSICIKELQKDKTQPEKATKKAGKAEKD